MATTTGNFYYWTQTIIETNFQIRTPQQRRSTRKSLGRTCQKTAHVSHSMSQNAQKIGNILTDY